MKLSTQFLLALLMISPMTFAQPVEVYESELVAAEEFADVDAMLGFLGMSDMDALDLCRGPNCRPGRPDMPGRQPPPRRPGRPDNPPPRRPVPPRPPPPYRPAPPPPYRPAPPPPYRPLPPPGYPSPYRYTCYAENRYNEYFVGESNVAQWAQDDAMYDCQRYSYECRPMGCRRNF